MIENATIKSESVEDWELWLLIIQGLEATDLKWEAANLNQQKICSSPPFLTSSLLYTLQKLDWKSLGWNIAEDSDMNRLKEIQ